MGIRHLHLAKGEGLDAYAEASATLAHVDVGRWRHIVHALVFLETDCDICEYPRAGSLLRRNAPLRESQPYSQRPSRRKRLLGRKLPVRHPHLNRWAW